MQELLTADLHVQVQVSVLHVDVHYLQVSLGSVSGPTKQFSRHMISRLGLSTNDPYSRK